MATFSFIHAADLHIESPYRGLKNMHPELWNALMKRVFDAFDTLIEQCIQQEVDFLLIAGDSFDSASGSLGAQYRFIRGLERLKNQNIRVFIVCGNHDPLMNWSKHLQLPDNVVRFGPDEVQKEIVWRGEQMLAAVYGVSYEKQEENRRLAQQFKNNDKALFSIGLLHGTFAGLSHKNPYCPFTLDELKAAQMNYWALGHIHKREVVHDNQPTVVYSGNLQGRHFNETGEKGCYLIKVDKNLVHDTTFIPLSKIVYEYHTLDISSYEGIGDLIQAFDEVKLQLTKNKNSYLIRFDITGITDLYNVLSDSTEIQKLLDEYNQKNDFEGIFFFVDRIINNTFPRIDLEERKKSSDFVADLLMRFEDYEKNDLYLLEEEVLSEIKGSTISNYISNLSEDELKEVIDVARWKCITGLTPKNQQT